MDSMDKMILERMIREAVRKELRAFFEEINTPPPWLGKEYVPWGDCDDRVDLSDIQKKAIAEYEELKRKKAVYDDWESCKLGPTDQKPPEDCEASRTQDPFTPRTYKTVTISEPK